MSPQARANLLETIAQCLTAEAQAPILAVALDGISGDDLVRFAVAVGRQTKFEIAAFDEPIANAARNAKSLKGLRASILSSFDDEGSDRFLLSTLDLTAADVAWMDEEIARPRAARLLRQLIDRAPEQALVAIQRNPASRDRILDILMDDVVESANQLVRIASSSHLEVDQLLDVGQAVLPHVPPDRRGRFAIEILGRGLAAGEVNDDRVQYILEDTANLLSPRQLIHMATPTEAQAQRIAANLVMMSQGSERIRHMSATAIEDLCDRLIHRYGENLGVVGYKAWASLLLEAGRISPAAQLRASLSALPFVMTKRDLPVSDVIVAAFPSVYFELLRSTGDEDFKRLPALLLLPLSIFYDWDRAKSARQEIVDAYLYSSWPPADLMVTSMAAGIENETLYRLEGTHRGQEYLGAIDRDSHRLGPAEFSKVQDCLNRHWRRTK
jgi:hypothetical protein